MIKKFTLSITVFLSFLQLQSQDTINLVHYNLLHYNNYTSYCTSSNNPLDEKNASLKVILDHKRPDIFTVNEMHCSSQTADILLDEVLNIGGIDYYQRAGMSCTGYLSNMIYYNSEKLGLASQDAVQTNVRVIDIYKLYHIPEDADLISDTIFLHVIVAHLKAGNDGDDAAERADEVQKLLDHLEQYYTPGNFVFAGDYNVYTSSETAFTKLINPDAPFRFFDPVEMIGNWHNNEYFAPVHTQSTHTSGGCPSSGGMDDRFDFILATEQLINGTAGVYYLPNSYHAIGQDGEHFNLSLLDPPTNTSVPQDVLQALYTMSDHLPVSMKVVVGEAAGINDFLPEHIRHLRVLNPVNHDINIRIFARMAQKINVELIDVMGRKIDSWDFFLHNGNNRIGFESVISSPGVYFLRFSFADGTHVTKKILKY